jgi:hypothetical protein
MRYPWNCKSCDPSSSHHDSDSNRNIKGRQVVYLGKGKWNEIKVEGGREGESMERKVGVLGEDSEVESQESR